MREKLPEKKKKGNQQLAKIPPKLHTRFDPSIPKLCALVAAADDDSVDETVPGCLCGGTITNLTAFVACDFCEVWYHRKCVGCDTPEAAER
jgi:hypothetical protein